MLNLRKLMFAGVLLAGLTALLAGGGLRPAANSQIPAPPLTWEDWAPVGAACGGVQYYVAISKDDGRNDFELKIKIENRNNHTVQTRFNAEVESADGVVKHHDNAGLGRLNAGRSADACSSYPSLCLGARFPAAVTQSAPTRIARLTLTSVDVANIDSPPKNASPGAYSDPYRDYPHTRCTNLTVTFGGAPASFVRLTDRCVQGLPRWTKPDCDDAVDQIVAAYRAATDPTEQDCIKEWRKYQKCYEIYAFNSAPDPRPVCTRPTCKIKPEK